MNVEILAAGAGFTEGPVVTQEGEILAVSIDQGRVYTCKSGKAEVFADVGGGPNGATEGLGEKIYIAQSGGQWGRRHPAFVPGITGGIQVVAADRSVSWVTMDPIAPSDLCFGPDNHLYVTDPTRHRTGDGRIWRVDVDSGRSEILVSVPWFPNGIGFGPESDALYVASTAEQRIVRFPITPDGLGPEETAIQLTTGFPDGFAFDVDGNLVIGAVSLGADAGDIQTWSSAGQLLDTFHPGTHRLYTNVALTPDRKLFVTDSDGGAVLVVEDWPRAGLPLYPFRNPDEDHG